LNGDHYKAGGSSGFYYFKSLTTRVFVGGNKIIDNVTEILNFPNVSEPKPWSDSASFNIAPYNLTVSDFDNTEVEFFTDKRSDEGIFTIDYFSLILFTSEGVDSPTKLVQKVLRGVGRGIYRGI